MRTGGSDAAALSAAGAILLTTATDMLQSSAFDPIYKEFDKVLINDKTDLSKLTDLTVWVFDDSVQPLQSYKYRVRLGVFNPIAGTDQFVENDNPLKNKTILWTNFVEPQNIDKNTYQEKNEVRIPARLYIFPMSVFNEMKKQINISVARHKFGYWYTKDYKVVPGDTIGKIERIRTDNETEEDPASALLQGVSSAPSQIDYSTGEILLDAVQTSEWTGGNNLYQRSFFQMLHSRDGTEISRTPIGDKFWPEELQHEFTEVKENEKRANTPVEPFRQFVDAKDRIKQRSQQKQTTTSTTTAPAIGDTTYLEQMLKRSGGMIMQPQ